MPDNDKPKRQVVSCPTCGDEAVVLVHDTSAVFWCVNGEVTVLHNTHFKVVYNFTAEEDAS